jgi:dTDP-4-amino-4,6-dideoxygalactose transaminase
MIAFNKPPFVGPELEYMKDAFARNHVSGDGYYGRKAEKILEAALGSTRSR